MLESDLQSAVMEAAILHGWLVHHQRPARTANGWRSTITGHKGWPDLVAVRAGRMLCWEFKSERGRLSPEQTEWLDRLRSVPGVDVRVVRPADLDEVLAVLR